MNDSRRKEITGFTSPLHHRSNAYKRRTEGLKGKNTLALEMVEPAFEQGIDADYLLIDSWHPKGTSVGRYAKPNFIQQANAMGMPVIARIANNDRIWNFKGKHRTLNVMYAAMSKVRRTSQGHYGKIRYRYFDTIVEHKSLGKIKNVVKENKDILTIIAVLSAYTKKELGFMCES